MAWRATQSSVFCGLLAGMFVVAIAAGADENVPDQTAPGERDPLPFRIVVMDPLSARLACDCVAGYARRDYDRLGEFLQERLAQPVEIAYAESLFSPSANAGQGIDLVIGKFSEVIGDAAKASLAVHTIAMLSGTDGEVTERGLFVVRTGDAARSIGDLGGYRLLFGPEDSLEKHSAAVASLEAFGLPIPAPLPTSPSCNTAAIAVVEEEADAAVVSSYAMPLLEGCGTIDKGALRIVGRTDPVPFVGVFAGDRVRRATEEALRGALAEVRGRPTLLSALESKDGFVSLPAACGGGAGPAGGWADWRGPHRDAISADVPHQLPATKRLLWSRVLTGPGMSGVAVDSGYVLVADKSLQEDNDIFRCLDADTGRQVWKLAYPAPGSLDYSNSPRATPVIHEGLVYLLGAFGDLHCVRLASGRVVWKCNLADDFGSKVPTWGFCSTPLLVDDKLIVNPGAEDASLVALDRLTGRVLWSAPGSPPGYASFILAEFGGLRQIVGYDAISLGGWDPATGERLWRLLPEFDGDFNVPTPIAVGDKLLVSTENNGTRLYGFDQQGRIITTPLAATEDLAPDTSTPVVHRGMVFGNFGGLVCLDLENNLNTLWETEEDPFAGYCSFIAGGGRVLVTAQEGKLCLLEASKKGFTCVSSLDLFGDEPAGEREVWSHPALVGNRLYVRNLLAAYCFLLE